MANTNSIDATHPLYDCRLIQWQRCRDCWEGQDAIKSRDGGRRYLPPTEGQLLDGAFSNGVSVGYPVVGTVATVTCGDGNIGQANYNAYLNRALFYGFYADAVQMSLGLAWTKEPIFEGLVGTPLEYLLTSATNEGESLARLLYRINEAQIGIGRIGLLADMPAGVNQGLPRPYITTYSCENIINWDSGRVGELSQETLNLVVLNETGPARNGPFEWTCVERYRVLALGPLETNELQGVYTQGVFEISAPNGGSGTPAFDPSGMIAPAIQGRQLNEIPFVFINATSATSAPVDPPLLSLADLVLALYQVSADWHAELHASTQATAVTKGTPPKKPGEKAIRLGVGGHLDLGQSPDADAFFLELEGKGLPELRQAVEKFRDLCAQRAGEVIDQSSRGRESGTALEQRISVRTANLHAIVQSGADGLEKLLKIMARWFGMTEEQIAAIKVRPNYVFSKPLLNATDLKALSETRLMGGAMISLSSLHNYLVNRGFTTLSFEEMKSQWEEEKQLAKELLPEPQNDMTKTGGANGGPAILPRSSGV